MPPLVALELSEYTSIVFCHSAANIPFLSGESAAKQEI
jgi:hypothetical protein